MADKSMTNKWTLLLAISATGATDAAWQKPAVDAVVLPAHAATSPKCNNERGWVEGNGSNLY